MTCPNVAQARYLDKFIEACLYHPKLTNEVWHSMKIEQFHNIHIQYSSICYSHVFKTLLGISS